MALWKPYPIVGGAYSDDTKPWTAQDTVNYIPVRVERAGGRSNELLRSAPGGSLFAVLGDGPIRGARDVEGKLLVVSGRTLYQVFADSTWTAIGTIPGVGRVQMTHNQIAGGNQVVIANGISGYVYNTYTEALTQITDEAFPGFGSVDFIAGYVAGVEPQGRYWFHSNLADALDYSSLDRYESEISPDLIVGLIETHGEVMVLSQKTCEFYANTGAATGTFQRQTGTSLEVGCASRHSIAKIDNSIIWLGNDGIVYRLNGYSALPISTGPMAQAISRCDMSRAFATVFDSRGHKIYYLTFPDGQTWGYDVTMQEWARRESYGLDRWRYNTLTHWNGVWIGGDYNSGKLLQLRWGYMREGVNPVVRSRTTGVLHDNQNPLTVNGLELVMDTGASIVEPALPREPLTIAGSLAGAYLDEPLTGGYTSNGGISPVQFTVTGGVLPAGVLLDPDTGLPAGNALETGTFTGIVTATDAGGNTATAAFSVTVAALSVVAIARPDYLVGTRYVMRSGDGVGWADPYIYTAASLGAPLWGNSAQMLEANGTVLAWSGASSANKPGRSTNAGASWTDAVSTYVMGFNGCAVSGAILIAGYSATPMWRSTDGGATFVNVGGSQVIVQSLSPTGLMAVARGKSGAVTEVTTDGGATWVAGGADPLLGVTAGGSATDGSYIYFGGKHKTIANTPALFKTTNGAAYTAVTLPTFATATTITCMAISPSGVKVVGTDSGEIAVDKNDGAGFVLAATSLGKLATAVVHNRSVFVMVGDAGGGATAGVIKTSAGGDVWTTATLPAALVLNGLAVARA